MEGLAASSGADIGDVPRSLPRGSHALPRHVVLLSQRRRLLEAVVEVAARRGYAATSVKDVIGAAGVSRQTFYEQFSDKEACFLAAYQEGGDAHHRAVAAAADAAGSPLEALQAGLETYIGVLAARPAFAHAFLLEIVGAGKRALAMHDQFRERYVALLERMQRELARERQLPAVSRDVLRGAAAAIDALIVHRLRVGTPEQIPELEPAALYLLLAVLGLDDAAEIAGLGG